MLRDKQERAVKPAHRVLLVLLVTLVPLAGLALRARLELPALPDAPGPGAQREPVELRAPRARLV